MCSILKIHHSGFYKWLKEPESPRTIENKEITKLIKSYWEESGRVYGSPNIYEDLKDAGYRYGLNRVARLMKKAGIKGAYRRKKHKTKWIPGELYQENTLNREFNVDRPNLAWCTDITYIHTHEGWLYLAVVLDLFHRGIVGWSMNRNQKTELVMDALFMAVKRRRPTETVLIHSDQGCQFTSRKWNSFCKGHSLDPSMSRRANCWDNSVVESFFSNLKREKIGNKVYKTRNDAKKDIFNYIELFYNPKRRHGYLGKLSPMKYEARYLSS